jgi:hypothetical protein
MSVAEEKPEVAECTPTNEPIPASRLPSIQSPRRQLSLKGLFLCVTYFAVSSALALRFGLGIFVTMNGVFLTWLSYRGYLWWIQTNKARPKLFGLAWLAFGASMFLPVIVIGCRPPNAPPPEPEYGWEIAWGATHMFIESAESTRALIVEPGKQNIEQLTNTALEWFWAAIANLPNSLLLLSPWALYRMQRDKGNWFVTAFGCAAVSSWMWSMNDGDELLIGYYVWSAAVSLPFFGKPPGWRTLLLMGLLGAFVVSVQWWAGS